MRAQKEPNLQDQTGKHFLGAARQRVIRIELQGAAFTRACAETDHAQTAFGDPIDTEGLIQLNFVDRGRDEGTQTHLRGDQEQIL